MHAHVNIIITVSARAATRHSFSEGAVPAPAYNYFTSLRLSRCVPYLLDCPHLDATSAPLVVFFRPELEVGTTHRCAAGLHVGARRAPRERR